jgi:hypothetical protein
MSKSKTRRAQRRREERRALARPAQPVWSQVELAFFAAAPPEQPEPAAAPDSFDDLVPPVPPAGPGWVEGLFAAARATFRRRATDH